jgi:hypothetical protein
MNREKSISLKYVPVELAGAAPVKFSIAKNLISQVLAHGLNVLKYGTSSCAVSPLIKLSAVKVPIRASLQVERAQQRGAHCGATRM